MDNALLTFLDLTLIVPSQPSRVQTLWKSRATEVGAINASGGSNSDTNDRFPRLTSGFRIHSEGPLSAEAELNAP